MPDDPRWDPEMRQAEADFVAASAAYPPIVFAPPFDAQRATNEALNLPFAAGGPAMAASEDRWVLARGRRVACRVHRPVAGAAAAPAMVYFHGGGWVWSSLDTHDRTMREYAAASGCTVVGVDYALSPEAKFPQALEECAGVVRSLAANGAAWGLDGTRLAVGGDSAGGNLALATALMLRDTGGPGLRGILALYPVCDSRFDTPSYREFGPGGFFLTAEKMRFYWSAYARDDADRLNPLAAPLRANLTGLPPVLVQLAELDVLCSEGQDLAGRLRTAGVDTELEVYPGLIHGFARQTGRVAKARDAATRAGTWLRRVLG